MNRCPYCNGEIIYLASLADSGNAYDCYGCLNCEEYTEWIKRDLTVYEAFTELDKSIDALRDELKKTAIIRFTLWIIEAFLSISTKLRKLI